ncbi:MAG: hypothetical protein DMF84_06455 [Acidobacteria bacterium]|nr:MAG: hypothetical protein DMF84_06455 [Acidobacteriota bacterium]
MSFYLPDREALGGADPLKLHPDRDWAIFGTGVYVWILQTFVRLHIAGAPVQLVDTPPPAGLVVAHADHLKRVLSEANSRADLIVVVAQSDRRPQSLADFAVVQNAASADRDHFFIPSWSQPGLVPRPPERGTRVENVAYFGSIKELDPDLASPLWAEGLRTRGVCWDLRVIAFSGNDHRYRELRWNDYSTVDVIVALRPRSAWDARPKPAAKLQNAWAAGIPAILSPERPYRELRRSALDYIEAGSRAEVLAAIDALRANPTLYSDMVQNGLERAREFRPERVVARWIDVLWREIPERAATPSYRLMAKARRYRALARRFKAMSFGASADSFGR